GTGVRVDVINLLRSEASVSQGFAHGTDARFAGGQRRRHVKSVVIQAVTEQLGIDFRAAVSSMFELFYNERSRAFADHKPITQFVEGPTGQFRRAFPLAHGLDKS